MNRVEDTLRDLPVLLRDAFTEAVAIRVSQRDALVRLCEAVRGDGFYEHLLSECDAASDVVIGHPGREYVIASATAPEETP